MTTLNFDRFFKVFALLMFAAVFLAGCQLGQSVMVSKGEAGGLSEAFGGQAEYCKITSTAGVELTEADRAAFRNYCTEAK